MAELGPVLQRLLDTRRLQAEDVAGLPDDPQFAPEELLMQRGLLTPQQVLEAMAGVHGVPAVLLSAETIDAEARDLIPADITRYHKVMGFRRDGDALVVAMADPSDLVAEDMIRFVTGLEVHRVVALEKELLRVRDTHHAKVRPGAMAVLEDEELVRTLSRRADLEGSAEGAADALEADEVVAASASPVVKAVHMLMSEAVTSKASDIHLEPSENGLRVRFRIDGALREIMTLPRLVQRALLARLKLISGMDIAETRKPQDGRTKILIGDHETDFRVSSLPTYHGEKIVMRLLDRRRAMVALEDMGLAPRDLSALLDFVRMPQGMLLITGPTGSGKTSTLYAALSRIHTEDTNIVTVEDPVEYQIGGINQVQVNPKAGLTFSNALRSILRQDPDVVMLGEIRDLETATIAFEAAMTGHLVLSTVHTNDAPSAITRLIHLGLPPYLVASSLVGVVAQRLVRKVCPECREEVPLTEDEQDILRRSGLSHIPARSFLGHGCKQCDGGYRGRLGIFEILRVTDQIRAAIYRAATEQELRTIAAAQGMHRLLEDGLAKAEGGLTSIDEVLKNAPAGTEEGVEGGPPAEAPKDRDPGQTARSDGAQPVEAGAQVGSAGTRSEAIQPAPPSVQPEKAPPSQPPAEPIRREAWPPPVPETPLAALPESGSSPARERILVVDDERTVLNFLAHVLEDAFYEVVAVDSGRRALELALSSRFDLIITDLEMPGMDGATLVHRLRGNPATHDIPVLFLSGRDSEDDEGRGLLAGADDYLFKPIGARRLAVRVEAALRRARDKRRSAS